MTAQPSDINTIKNLPANRKTALGIFLLVLFVLGTGLGIMVARNRDVKTDTTMTPNETANTTKTTGTSLTLSPATKTVKVGEAFPVSVRMAGDSVQAVDVVLTYDPAIFSVSEIKPGVFPKILREKITPGQIVVSASVTPDNPTAVSEGDIFTFSLTALKKSQLSTLEFDRKDTITAQSGVNTLGTTTGAEYIVE